jgi:hypothetical protein
VPTRRITASPVKVTGAAPDGQQFESSLEEDFFCLLRFNRLVASFEHQPVTLEWLDPTGRIRKYTPDVLVRYRKDDPEAAELIPVLCEVKPDISDGKVSPRRKGQPRTENEDENALKWAAAERYAAHRGWGFKVYRESEIRTPYLTNARFLLRHCERKDGPQSSLETRLLKILDTDGAMTLRDWAAAGSSASLSPVESLPACYRLVGIGSVSADLDRLLTLDSMISPRLHA